MSIGQITVDLLARTGSFETDMGRAAKTAEKRAKEIDAAVSKAGAAVATALGAAGAAVLYMGKQIIDGLDALNDVKDATGASIENISALEDVALRTGATMENVSGILVKFNSALKEADGKNAVSQALKAIGLDAAELRKEDPAEALRKTAVALSGFADDGNKARLVQELFGKSIKDAAPFLNDLAEKTKLVGTVSAEEAANAEKFNKQLFDLQKNSLDAKRALVSDLLPGISRVIEEFNIGRKVAGSFLDAILTFGTINPFRSQQGNLKALRGEIEGLEGDRQRYQRSGSDTRAIDEALANSQKQYTFLKALQQRDALADVGDTSDAVSRKFLREKPKPSAPDVANFKTGSGGAKKDNSAAQEAKAQLAQDLEDMKKSTAALAGAFDNDEKILSALRSASLISDADYYQKKRDIIIATGEVEDAGLQASIDRLKKEQATLDGKDAIDNQRKLNDAEAELRKSRADTATQLKVLNIEATDSTTKLTTAMVDARVAAQSFLDTTNRARALELAGMGQGTKTRDLDGAISQIEQTYEQKRQDLERDNRNGKFKDRKDDYNRELALIDEFQKKSVDSYKTYFADLEQRQASFSLGASEAARNYFDESKNAFKQTQEAVTHAFEGMEGALVDFVKTGKLDVKSLVDSIISDFARIVIKQQITGPLAGLVGEALKGGGGAGAVSGDADYLKLIGLSGSSGLGTTGGSGGGLLGQFGSWLGGIFGGTFAAGGTPPMGKVSLVGEKGPELFVPNTAGKIIPNHELGGSGQQVVVNINNTIGDVASMAQVLQAQQGTERRIAAEIARNRTRGGVLAS